MKMKRERERERVNKIPTMIEMLVTHANNDDERETGWNLMGGRTRN